MQASELLQRSGREEGGEGSWDVAGFFRGESELGADRVRGRGLHEGGRGVGGGFVPAILLRKREGEVMTRERIGGVRGEDDAVGFFGRRKIAALVIGRGFGGL